MTSSDSGGWTSPESPGGGPAPADPGQVPPVPPGPGGQFMPPAPQPHWGPDAPLMGPGDAPGGTTPPPPRQSWNFPRPGIIPLRPLGLSDMFEGSFAAIRSNPKAMLATSLVVIGVASAVGLAIQLTLMTLVGFENLSSALDDAASQETLDLQVAQSVGTFITIPLTFIVTVILTGLLIVAISEAVLGKRVTVGHVWAEGRKHLWRLLGLTLLIALLMLVALAVVGSLTALLAYLVRDANWAIALVVTAGVLVGLALLIWLWVIFSLSSPALVLEKSGILASLRRSRTLIKGFWWRTFGILLVTALIVGFVTGVLGAITGVVQVVALAVGTGQALVGSTILSAVLGGLIQALALPFQVTVTALIYIDLRMRKEGLDVQLLQASGQNS